MPNGKKKKGHKMATHKRKKRLRKNRHKSKLISLFRLRGVSANRARFVDMPLFIQGA